MHTIREAIEKIRKITSRWLTDEDSTSSAAMSQVADTLLNTTFEHPEVITLSADVSLHELEDFKKIWAKHSGQPRTLIDEDASEWRTPASHDVLVERRRQVEAEGYAPEHDDEHTCDEIAACACLYAMPPAARDWDASSSGYGATFGEAMLPEGWGFKAGDRRHELVKAGALILAEIERLDRFAALDNLTDEIRANSLAVPEPTGDLPEGLSWDKAPYNAIALVAGREEDGKPSHRLIVWVSELGRTTRGVLAREFDRRPAGTFQVVALDNPNSAWTVIATRPQLAQVDGWVNWDAAACLTRPNNVARIRYQNGREDDWYSGANWAPQSDSFRHHEIVAYLPKSVDDGWIQWDHSEWPGPPGLYSTQSVWVRLEGEDKPRLGFVKDWDWSAEPKMGRSRIVAYRITDPVTGEVLA